MTAHGYPTMGQVEAAGANQLMRWNRYLASPDDEEYPVMAKIVNRLSAVRRDDPDAYVRASKEVGWA